uniref:Uncharacterized protein n=1 Tax=Parascaris univalens TaxID=6257 RepID=A0A915AJ34_PARUN
MAAKLRTAILKYRIMEKTIDKLHRSVVEIEAVNITCIARFTAVVYCGLQCSKLEGSGSPVGYCSDACTNAVRNCLGESAADWDSFVTILRKLSIDFDSGFSELERGVIASISHAVEIQAPAIAKVVLKKCGPAGASKSALSNSTLGYDKPVAVQRKLVGMIRKFTSYIGWWQRLAQNVCSDASRMSTCWNGTTLISRLGIRKKEPFGRNEICGRDCRVTAICMAGILFDNNYASLLCHYKGLQEINLEELYNVFCAPALFKL